MSAECDSGDPYVSGQRIAWHFFMRSTPVRFELEFGNLNVVDEPTATLPWTENGRFKLPQKLVCEATFSPCGSLNSPIFESLGQSPPTRE